MLKQFQEQCYDNLRVSRNAWDTNLVKVRSKLCLHDALLIRIRLIQATCLSIGKLEVEELSPSYHLKRRAGFRNTYLYSEAILLLFLILIGAHGEVNSIYFDADFE